MIKIIRSILLLLMGVLLCTRISIAQNDTVDTAVIIPSESFTQSKNKPQLNESTTEVNSISSYIKSGFNNNDVIIRFCYWFVLVCLMFFVGISIFIFGNRNVVASYKKRKAIVYQDLQELLTEYIYLDVNDTDSTLRKSEIRTEFKKINLTSPFYSRLLRSEILELHKQFKGDASNILKQLYIDLGFEKNAIKKLKYDNWTIRSAKIRELAQMEITDAAPRIKLSLNHINPTLRLEAGIALLKLDKENPFALLDIDKELTRWQMINLLEAIITSSELVIPEFKIWLKSNQASIVIFSLIMIEYYHQLGAEDEIMQLLDTNHEDVLNQAIKTLGTLESFSAEEKLIDIFNSTNSYYTKQAVIDAVSKIGSEESIAFLINQLKIDNRDIALQSAYAIKNIGINGVDILKERLIHASNETLEYIVIKHSLDEHLSLR